MFICNIFSIQPFKIKNFSSYYLHPSVSSLLPTPTLSLSFFKRYFYQVCSFLFDFCLFNFNFIWMQNKCTLSLSALVDLICILITYIWCKFTRTRFLWKELRLAEKSNNNYFSPFNQLETHKYIPNEDDLQRE